MINEHDIKDYNSDEYYQPEQSEPIKLWNLPRGSFFRIAGEEPVYFHSKTDGMYSINYGVTEEVKHDGIYFFAVFTPVVQLLKKTHDSEKTKNS